MDYDKNFSLVTAADGIIFIGCERPISPTTVRPIRTRGRGMVKIVVMGAPKRRKPVVRHTGEVL